MFGFGPGSWLSRSPEFATELRSFPVCHCGRDDLEAGNRLLLPPSALRRLQEIGAPSPLLFEVSDLDGRCRTHAGVLEFVAPEESCFVPQWILEQLGARAGDVLRLRLKPLQPATFVRFRPASVALLRVYNPRALLENGLRNFVAVTEGDSFAVEYNGQKYRIAVEEVRPGGAASLIETDVSVEFSTPEDAQAAAEGLPAGGGAAQSSSPSQAPAARRPPRPPGAFEGEGRRLDGGQAPDLDEGEAALDPTPWKRAVRGGVKWTTAPYGCESLRIVGEASHFRRTPDAVLPLAGEPSAEGRARAREAAEVRLALQAEEVERRRREEAEEQRRLREEQEAEAARRKAALEEARRRRGPAQPAPVQKTMDGGGAGPRRAGAASGGGGPLGLCGCCLRMGSGRSGEQGPPPARV